MKRILLVDDEFAFERGLRYLMYEKMELNENEFPLEVANNPGDAMRKGATNYYDYAIIDVSWGDGSSKIPAGALLAEYLKEHGVRKTIAFAAYNNLWEIDGKEEFDEFLSKPIAFSGKGSVDEMEKILKK